MHSRPAATRPGSDAGFRLELSGLGRRHPKADQWLLRKVSCQIVPGDRLALVGPSGSGKSLLLRTMALLDPWDEGQIRWQGQSVSGNDVPDYRRQVIYLHQQPALVEGTVQHNLRQPFLLQAHQQKLVTFDEARAGDLLEQLNRDDSFLGKQQNVLSGGEAQLVSLVRAMQLDPHVLLLDEPTASLDQTTARAVEQLVDRWLSDQPAARAIVWVSHDAQQAARVSQRRLRMRHGRVERED